jgi:hypothetical protein
MARSSLTQAPALNLAGNAKLLANTDDTAAMAVMHSAFYKNAIDLGMVRLYTFVTGALPSLSERLVKFVHDCIQV